MTKIVRNSGWSVWETGGIPPSELINARHIRNKVLSRLPTSTHWMWDSHKWHRSHDLMPHMPFLTLIFHLTFFRCNSSVCNNKLRCTVFQPNSQSLRSCDRVTNPLSMSGERLEEQILCMMKVTAMVICPVLLICQFLLRIFRCKVVEPMQSKISKVIAVLQHLFYIV